MRAAFDIKQIAEDFEERTLSYLEGGLPKLVFLSSCRDYNSGLYRHDGLAAEFSELAVHEALSLLHRQIFEQICAMPLQQWVAELRAYMGNTDSNSLQVWRELRPYNLLFPLGVSTVSIELVMSNLKIALELLDSESRAGSPAPE